MTSEPKSRSTSQPQDRYNSASRINLRFFGRQRDDDGKASEIYSLLLSVGTFGNVYLSVCTDAGDPAATSGIIVGRYIGSEPSSEDHFRLAEKWLKDCVKNHTTCGQLQEPHISHGLPALPTRVLDVGTNFESQVVRLYESDHRPGRYVTLSYCWGTSMAVTTEWRTLQQRKTAIGLSTLPKTLRDAVRITRRLGVQFLWIDALCIIQDSVKDWQIESSRMGEIYRNAFFTISADGARDGSEGCFMPRMPPDFDSVTVNLQLRDGTPCIIAFGPDHPTDGMAIRGNRGVPLDDRGWTLQERLLSRRILHYGKKHMFWECEESSVFEYGKTINTGNWTKKNFFCNMEKDWKIYNPGLIKKIYGSWRDIIWAYTARKLTRETDKLPALSGLAKTFHAHTGDQYLSGIWAADLLDGLSWEAVPDEMGPITRPMEYRAPSWSWASVNGPVWYPDSVQGEPWEEVQLIDAKVDMLGHDHHGQVTGGRIRISGLFYSIFNLVKKGTNLHFVNETQNVVANLSFDVEGTVPGPVTCLLLRAQETIALSPTLRTNVIILEPTGIELDQFRRLGFGLLRGNLTPVVRRTIVIV